MAEIVPVVYDIAQPTPVSLKDLSAITVSLEIWSNEIRKHRTNSTIERFTPLTLDISSKTVLDRDLPSVIYDVIDKFIPRFGPSLFYWRVTHESIFQLHSKDENSVLEVFDNFIADYCGTIDYVRTAKRMMVCDRLSEVEKFAIACTYFFKEEIRRIWPSVCESFDLNSMDFDELPQLFYWICHFKNEWNRIPCLRNRSVDEVMFDHRMVENRPSLEYFWNRVSVENRMRKAIDIYRRDVKLFVTFVLPKLNDEQLGLFVNTNGCKLILKMLNDRLRDNWFFLPTWKFIRHKMNDSTFRTLVVEMLKIEQTSAFEGCSREPQNWLHYCSLIWNSIPTNLKHSIVEDILSNTKLFEMEDLFQCSRRFVGFLLLILSSATFEQRSTFWRECWPHLVEGTRSEDLLRIMKLCFENSEEIAQFKGSVLAKSENVSNVCSKLLSFGMFEELNDLVDFYWPEVEAAKDYKLQLLRSTFIMQNYRFTRSLVERVDEFSVFIDVTFDSNYQSTDFKNQLMLSFANQYVLSRYPCSLHPSVIEGSMKLVDTFVSTEQTVRAIKMRMMSCLTEFILKNREDGDFDERRFETPVFEQFLLWLLGGCAEKVDRFRQTYCV